MKIRFYSGLLQTVPHPRINPAHGKTRAEKIDIVLKNFPVKRVFEESVTPINYLYSVETNLAEYKLTLEGTVEKMW